MPSTSPSQHRLMEAAAHTPGGYGGVPQAVGKEFVAADAAEPVITELDIARKMRDGDLPSPQKLNNAWLFDLRVTGTGISFRPQLDEYVYRPPEHYLTAEFLERCQGLPVIFEHPDEGLLTTDEFRERSIGSIILPYIPPSDDDIHLSTEVWGIARIFDGDAADLMMGSHVSTSPGVGFGAVGSTKTIRTADGSRLLIEGEPSQLDHLAVCDIGVWDKGGDARGVNLSALKEQHHD